MLLLSKDRPVIRGHGCSLNVGHLYDRSLTNLLLRWLDRSNSEDSIFVGVIETDDISATVTVQLRSDLNRRYFAPGLAADHTFAAWATWSTSVAR